MNTRTEADSRVDRAVFRAFDQDVDGEGLRAMFGLPLRFRFAGSSYRLSVTPADKTGR